MSIVTRLRDAIETALSVDHEQFDRAFTLALLAVVGTMLAVTPQYRENSQEFPLVIGVPTFLLLVFLLGIQFSPRIRARVTGYTTSKLFDVEGVVADFDATEGGRAERSLAEERRSVIAIALWTVFLFVLVILTGFLPGTLVFMLAFYRIQADQSWRRSIFFSAAMWVFIVVIFEVVLNTPFYTGVFDIELPLPL